MDRAIWDKLRQKYEVAVAGVYLKRQLLGRMARGDPEKIAAGKRWAHAAEKLVAAEYDLARFPFDLADMRSPQSNLPQEYRDKNALHIEEQIFLHEIKRDEAKAVIDEVADQLKRLYPKTPEAEMKAAASGRGMDLAITKVKKDNRPIIIPPGILHHAARGKN